MWNANGCVVPSPNGPQVDLVAAASELSIGRPDLIMLQEVLAYDDGRPSQAEQLARMLGLKHFAQVRQSPSAIPECRGDGTVCPDENALLCNAILSRYELTDVATVELPWFRLQADVGGEVWVMHHKAAIGADVRIGGEAVALVNFHAHPFHRFGRSADDGEFASFWQATDAFIASRQKVRMVVGADANVWGMKRLMPWCADNLIEVVSCPPGISGGDTVMVKGFDLEGGVRQGFPPGADHYAFGFELSPHDYEPATGLLR